MLGLLSAGIAMTSMIYTLYDSDYVAWSAQQSELLKQKRFHELDLEHLIDEVEDLGNRHRDALESHLERLLLHLLKWEYQPSMRSGSWKGSIQEARKRIALLFKRHPSLKSYPAEVLQDAYELGRLGAIAETGLAESMFPLQCPYSIKQVLDVEFLPGDRLT
jgi:hypothetical protein